MADKIKMAAAKITVSGMVQGVGFRYFIARAADELNLKGYAKNLFNGNVEIYAEGRQEFIEKLRIKTRVLEGESEEDLDRIAQLVEKTNQFNFIEKNWKL